MRQEFNGYAARIEAASGRLRRLGDHLLPLAQGGTAVGTGLNCPPGFVGHFLGQVRALTGLAVTEAPDHMAVTASKRSRT